MPALFAFIERILTTPAVLSALPGLVEAVGRWFAARAERLELRAAVQNVKAAETAEELRRASERLSNAVSRP